MDTVTFDVRCQQERRRIGEVSLRDGMEPDAIEIVRQYRPDTPAFSLVDARGNPTLKDGQQALCPRCKGPLLIAEPGKPEKGVYIVPTRMRIQA